MFGKHCLPQTPGMMASVCLVRSVRSGWATSAARARLCTATRIQQFMESQNRGSEYLHKLEHERLEKVLMKTKVDPKDEKTRLNKILDTVTSADGTHWVPTDVRGPLRARLLLWKHDED